MILKKIILIYIRRRQVRIGYGSLGKSAPVGIKSHYRAAHVPFFNALHHRWAGEKRNEAFRRGVYDHQRVDTLEVLYFIYFIYHVNSTYTVDHDCFFYFFIIMIIIFFAPE